MYCVLMMIQRYRSGHLLSNFTLNPEVIYLYTQLPGIRQGHSVTNVTTLSASCCFFAQLLFVINIGLDGSNEVVIPIVMKLKIPQHLKTKNYNIKGMACCSLKNKKCMESMVMVAVPYKQMYNPNCWCGEVFCEKMFV